MSSVSLPMCLIVGGIVLLALVVYLCMSKNSGKEGYSNIGDLDNIGSNYDSSYELVTSPEDDVPAQHFADMIDAGDQQKIMQPNTPLEAIRPMERLERIQGRSLMPRTSKHVTPYNIDVADPIVHSFQVNPPRVLLKDPNKDYSAATFMRGDIPISYFPNVSIIGRSRYGRDSLVLDGFFSDAFQALYSKYTGKGYKNLPLKVVNGETIMDNIE